MKNSIMKWLFLLTAMLFLSNITRAGFISPRVKVFSKILKDIQVITAESEEKLETELQRIANSSGLIETHSGIFHTDEVLACSFLLLSKKWGKNPVIVRSRNQKVLDRCDVVVDVGGVFDPARNRYDHHQQDFYRTFNASSETPMSSAGLVYQEIGRDLKQKKVL